MANGFSDEAINAFEIFDDLCELSIPGISNLIPDLVIFVLEIGSNPKFDSNIRQKALTFIEWVAT